MKYTIVHFSTSISRLLVELLKFLLVRTHKHTGGPRSNAWTTDFDLGSADIYVLRFESYFKLKVKFRPYQNTFIFIDVNIGKSIT